tara:strand:- start:4 stop:447 length:444 start_codon:yes stop_codon:yes gene_type:complete
MFNPIQDATVTKAIHSRFDIDLRDKSTEELVEIINSCGNWWKSVMKNVLPSSGAKVVVTFANGCAGMLSREGEVEKYVARHGSNFDRDHCCFAVVAATELLVRAEVNGEDQYMEREFYRMEAYMSAYKLWKAHGGEVPLNGHIVRKQ